VVHAKQKRVYRRPGRRRQGRGAQDAGVEAGVGTGALGHQIRLLAGPVTE